VGVNPPGVAVADFNADFRVDLAVANQGSDTVSLLVNDGAGNFGSAADYAAGAGPSGIVVSDFNNDGLTDVAVTNYYGGSVSVLLRTTEYSAQVLQPIDTDGSSVFKASRGVVPVKFTLKQNGTITCDLPAATIAVFRTSGIVPEVVDENEYLLASDSGSNFRIDATNCQYVYNLATSSLGTGAYTVQIRINTAIVGSGAFALR
jgi:hypothetical protein